MKCIICHGDNIKAVEVKEEFHLGNDIVFFPVTIPVCQTCGERYYDRRTMEQLERVEEKVKSASGLKEIGKLFMYEEVR
jgi:YgiT-type zinc finger domain-containing protein